MKEEFNIQKSNQLKSIAILMMVFLHLFNRDYNGLFQPLIFIGKQPLSYYISLFCDACVPIFAFVSGYGLFYKYQADIHNYSRSNRLRIGKLYITYWIILIVFVVVLGLLLSEEGYPGDFKKFVLNLTAVEVSYNAAWWFLTTYILFVLTSSFWFKMLLKLNPYIYLLFLLLLYVASFYFRVYKTSLFSSLALDWLHKQVALYFCTLFQFMLGAFALRYQIHSKFTEYVKRLRNKNYFLIISIVVLVFLHALIPNLIIAPFIAFIFILLYCQLEISRSVQKVIDFFTSHATNIWLIHMFFYLIYFREFIYSFKYVLPIYFVLILCCILSSYFINYINAKVQKLV